MASSNDKSKLYPLFCPLKLIKKPSPPPKADEDEDDDEDDDVPLMSLAKQGGDVENNNNTAFSIRQKRKKENDIISKPRPKKKNDTGKRQTNAERKPAISRKGAGQTRRWGTTASTDNASRDEAAAAAVAAEVNGAHQPQLQPIQILVDRVASNTSGNKSVMQKSSQISSGCDGVIIDMGVDGCEKQTTPNNTRQQNAEVRPNRRYSSTSMDFTPTDSDARDCRRPSHILDQIVRRSTHGTHLVHARRQPQRWKSPSWLELEQPVHRSIEHLAWDTMGVLLATSSSDNMIRIYDWDMVLAADQKGRSQRARNKQDSSNQRAVFHIPPILAFSVPNPVASLQWNPHNLDQLAVGFR
jgi:hypothetical protein